MKFSIVIPVYNTKDYLAACIESVLQQRHQNFELLLVDDGSTDDSGRMCDQYASSHPDKVRVFHKINQGPYRARIFGVDHASGDAVLFIDADDALRPDALALIARHFEASGCDMVLYNASRDEDFHSACLPLPFADGQCFCGETKKALYEAVILSSNLNSLCTKAFRRELFASLPPHCRDFTGRNGEDLWLLLPLLTAAERIVYLQQNLYFYRSRPQSIVHSYSPLRHRSVRAVHQEMEKYIDRWGMQALHAKHYAREVRGWVDCLKMALKAPGTPDRQLLHELAEDAYFRNAWARMDGRALSRRDALLAHLLHGRRYGLLMTAASVLRAARAARNLLKGRKS